MKKWSVALGAFFLLLTPILISTSSITSNTSVMELAGEHVSDWTCRGNFTRGQTIIVSIRQNINWSRLVDADRFKYVYLEIVDPMNGSVRYELEYILPEGSIALKGTYARVLKVNGNGIKIEENETVFAGEFTAGIANYDGTYLARITDIYPPVLPCDKPSYFALFRSWNKTVRPYASLIYSSAATLPLGLIFLALGLKGSNRRRKPKVSKLGKGLSSESKLRIQYFVE
jgi:hypothetical protein